MENNKQTSVEWLQQALEDTILTHEQIMQTIGLFEQAKEMEKEQIINAVDGYPIANRNLNGIEYYEQTYGDNK
jgi:hypothetical protein